ncbi:PEP-CTERM sorting domain-containing protein [Caldimonas brevitalea]|uniref:PEP-CTERM sorting domain-containing protein n=1 Tax=Caldimonas brevitalea TaxID=413882 RepID=UPI00147040B7|nr:PEP-CTERM sorting domain-containing protein [Caldimonas brevitalea]
MQPPVGVPRASWARWGVFVAAAIAALPAIAAPVQVDYKVEWTHRYWLHNGFYVSTELGEPPAFLSVTFENTVLPPEPDTLAYRLGLPDSSRWDLLAASENGSTWVTQGQMNADFLTRLHHGTAVSRRGDGYSHGYGRAMSLEFLTADLLPVTSNHVWQLVSGQLGEYIGGQYQIQNWAMDDEGKMLWDENFYGLVSIVGAHAIPEPGSAALLGGGLALLVGLLRRRTEGGRLTDTMPVAISPRSATTRRAGACDASPP